MSCAAIAKVLLLDDDTIRTWHRLYEEDGIEGLASFGHEGSACRLNGEQQDKLKAWITETLPRSTREVGAWIEKECGIDYQGRSGLIALLHRLGMEHRKPKAVSRKLDPDKQAAFIKAYEELLNQLPADEAVMFADAVHPMHAVRPVGCWAPKDTPIAIAQTSGRQRLNIHGAIDLETGKTRMLDVVTVNAVSTIMLLMAIEAMYPGKRMIHLFLDNARYHCGLRRRRPPIPISRRPPLRSDAGHHSDLIAARLASSRGRFWSSHSGAGWVKRECAACLKAARHFQITATSVARQSALVTAVTSRGLNVGKFTEVKIERLPQVPQQLGCRSDYRAMRRATWRTRPVVQVTRQLRHANAAVGCVGRLAAAFVSAPAVARMQPVG